MPHVKQETLKKILEDGGRLAEEVEELRRALASITKAQDLEEAANIAHKALAAAPEETPNGFRKSISTRGKRPFPRRHHETTGMDQ